MSNLKNMKAIVSIIMGSTSDMPVMKKAAEFLMKWKFHLKLMPFSTQNTSNS